MWWFPKDTSRGATLLPNPSPELSDSLRVLASSSHQTGKDPRMPFRGSLIAQKRVPGSPAPFPQFILVIEKKERFLRKSVWILHFDSCSFLLQEFPGVQEILHRGSVENHFSPHRRLKRVLSAQGHQAGATENDRSHAVDLEEISKGVDDDYGCSPLALRVEPGRSRVDIPGPAA